MDPKDMDLGHILDDVDLNNSKNIRDAVQKEKNKIKSGGHQFAYIGSANDAG